MKNAKNKKSCDINLSKVKERSVKVFVDDKKHNGVEIFAEEITESNDSKLAKNSYCSKAIAENQNIKY
jgi:hypothetical protein